MVSNVRLWFKPWVFNHIAWNNIVSIVYSFNRTIFVRECKLACQRVNTHSHTHTQCAAAWAWRRSTHVIARPAHIQTHAHNKICKSCIIRLKHKKIVKQTQQPNGIKPKHTMPKAKRTQKICQPNSMLQYWPCHNQAIKTGAGKKGVYTLLMLKHGWRGESNITGHDKQTQITS